MGDCLGTAGVVGFLFPGLFVGFLFPGLFFKVLGQYIGKYYLRWIKNEHNFQELLCEDGCVCGATLYGSNSRVCAFQVGDMLQDGM